MIPSISSSHKRQRLSDGSSSSSSDITRHCRSKPTADLNQIFAKPGLPTVITKYLTISDLAKIVRTSKSIESGVGKQFRLFLKKGINRGQVEKPITHFYAHPEDRELYIIFDENGKQHVQGLIQQNLGNYYLETTITTSFTATRINILIEHLKSQIENYRGDLNELSSIQKEALERGRMLVDLHELESWHLIALIRAPRLTRADVVDLTDAQVNALIQAPRLTRADVVDLTDAQVNALIRASRLTRTDVIGLTDAQVFILSLNRNLTRADIVGLTDSDARDKLLI